MAPPETVKFEAYRTSSAQKRMFLVNHLLGDSTLYNMPAAWIVKGVIEPARLEAAFLKMIARHETLRTAFALAEGRVLQKVYDTIHFKLRQRPGSGAEIERIIDGFIRPFDLETPPLWRAELVQLGGAGQLLLFDIHHIISDSFSQAVIIRELTDFYRGRELPRLEFQYVDFTTWQNKMLSGPRLKAQVKYWLDIFAGEIPVLELPVDAAGNPEPGIGGGIIEFEIDHGLCQGLKQLALDYHTSLYVVLLAAYNVLLSRYSGQEDIVVGTPVSGRSHREFEGIIGMFVNMLAMRNRPCSDKAFADFLGEVSGNTFSAFENQDYQFEMLVEKLAPAREVHRNPLFNTILTLQTPTPAGGAAAAGGPAVEFVPYPIGAGVAKFDLSLFAVEVDRHIAVGLEYRTALSRPDTIRRMAGHFLHLLREIVAHPRLKIAGFQVLSPGEKAHLLDGLARPAAPGACHRDQTLHHWFGDQVKKGPDRVALVDTVPVKGTGFLTYRKLWADSLRLADHLRGQGVRPHEVVALMVERSAGMIAAMLGILQAGGAYLPIDPAYPGERIDYMLTDSGAGLVMDRERCILPPPQAEPPGRKVRITPASPASLAYVIYTSGTSGRPKGTLIEHRSVVGLMDHCRAVFDFGSRDCWTLFHSYCFDFSVWEMYGALLYGGKLVVVSRLAAMDTPGFWRLLRRQGVTVLNQTPSAFYPLAAEALKQGEDQLGLRVVILGGEALNPLKLKALHKRYPAVRLVNMFGITETTVHVTYKQLAEQEISQAAGNIGQPLPNLNAYILGRGLQLLPQGIPGELCVSGTGVGRGYLNRPELTAEKFVDNPYGGNDIHGTLYRSGDRVKLGPDGDMVYLGRLDQQVKIRGYRVELGEIESRLLEHRAVGEAVVVKREAGEGDFCLCAYIVPVPAAGGDPPTAAELREYLAGRLPGYMVPAYFLLVARIPLTANGKIDYRALPTPAEGGAMRGTPPENPVQQKLAQVWARVLGVGPQAVGIDDDFFSSGGHSLKAAQLLSEIHREFDVRILLTALFQGPTIRGLAAHIRQADTERFEAIRLAEKRDYYALSSPQKRLYIMNQLDPVDTAYNLTVVVKLEGRLQEAKGEAAFARLIRRHETLRTSFRLVASEPVQKVHEEVDFAVSYFDPGSAGQEKRIIEEFIRPFDLTQAPLLRVGLIRLAEGAYILMMDIYHIITDGISMGVLFREFMALYGGAVLPRLKVQYKDYSQWQNSPGHQGELKKQEAYWLNRFSGGIPEPLFPADRSWSGDSGRGRGSLYFTIDGTSVATIRALMKATGTTLYMVLLAAYYVLLSRHSGQEDIVVGSPVTGRSHPDWQGVIGVFINSLALRNFPCPAKTFREFLGEVRESVLAAFENQDYHFEELVKRLGVRRQFGRNPVYNVMFALQNFETGPQALPGVQNPDLKLVPYDYENKAPDFDLVLETHEVGDSIRLYFGYAAHLFGEPAIKEVARQYREILAQAAANGDIRLADIRLNAEAGRADLHFSREDYLDFKL
jgi:amino acid adenylation domain-containing protein